jgi:hypothetical protein
MAHGGAVRITDMLDEHLLNAYKTCVRMGNYDKDDELIDEIEHRNLQGRLSPVGVSTQP